MNTEITTKKVQEVEFDILSKIDLICKKHNLTYFAIGGTALGALRHQGFIPWDDDIDIGMPRKDYEAFLSFAEQELPCGYFLQNFSTEPRTPFYFTKIRKDNTKFVEFYLKDVDIHHGIFVDIFPFDNVPNDALLRKLHFRFCRIAYHLWLSRSLSTVCSSRFQDARNYKIYVRKIAHVLLLPFPKKWFWKLLDTSVQFFNDHPSDEISHIARKRLRVRLDDLYPIRYLPFGEVQMPVPNHCEAYLSAQFGNYEVSPPEEKRYGHLPYLVEFEEGSIW